jgi:hypothetical protein
MWEIVFDKVGQAAKWVFRLEVVARGVVRRELRKPIELFALVPAASLVRISYTRVLLQLRPFLSAFEPVNGFVVLCGGSSLTYTGDAVVNAANEVCWSMRTVILTLPRLHCNSCA